MVLSIDKQPTFRCIQWNCAWHSFPVDRFQSTENIVMLQHNNLWFDNRFFDNFRKNRLLFPQVEYISPFIFKNGT